MPKKIAVNSKKRLTISPTLLAAPINDTGLLRAKLGQPVPQYEEAIDKQTAILMLDAHKDLVNDLFCLLEIQVQLLEKTKTQVQKVSDQQSERERELAQLRRDLEASQQIQQKLGRYRDYVSWVPLISIFAALTGGILGLVILSDIRRLLANLSLNVQDILPTLSLILIVVWIMLFVVVFRVQNSIHNK